MFIRLFQKLSMPTDDDDDLSKQLSKLKHFLSTIYYFGSDISSEIGERSRALIIALVVSLIRVFFVGYLVDIYLMRT